MAFECDFQIIEEKPAFGGEIPVHLEFKAGRDNFINFSGEGVIFLY